MKDCLIVLLSIIILLLLGFILWNIKKPLSIGTGIFIPPKDWKSMSVSMHGGGGGGSGGGGGGSGGDGPTLTIEQRGGVGSAGSSAKSYEEHYP